MLEALTVGLVQVFTWPTLPLMLLGTAMGFAVGILPGLGGVVALALMLPFTFSMDSVSAFAFLLGMLAVTATTGDITSILFGVPGESISAATVLDGHPMAKNGEAGRALGAALMSSLVGAIIGALLLALAIPIMRPLVLSFASPEFFALSLLGILFMAAVSGANVLKGVIAGGLGLMLSMVGLDPLIGIERYTFGRLELWEGISLVAVTTGLFGIPEVLDLWTKRTSIAERAAGKLGGVWEGVKDTFRHWGITVRCSALGTFMGIIPGLGASIGQWVAYAHAVQSSPNRERFGKGDVRGVLGPGAANNSALGGGLIPTIAFGVPSNVVFAILLGAFLIQGLTPGPVMLTKHLDLVFSFVWIIVVTNIITVAICFVFIKQLVRITEVRGAILIPSIIVLILLGGYVESHTLFALFLTLAAGAVGYVMVHLDWPRPPLILGLVLGRLVEKNLFTSYQAYGADLVLRPVVILVLIVGIGVVAWPVWQRFRSRCSRDAGTVFGATSRLELATCTVIALLLTWALWAARSWPFQARLFPWTIGFPLLALALTQLGISAHRLFVAGTVAKPSVAAQTQAEDGALVLSPELTTSIHDLEARASAMEHAAEIEASPEQRGKPVTIVAWCFAFAFLIGLLGFKIGASLSTFLFLWLAARESWKITLGLAVGTYLFFVIAGDLFKLTELDSGVVADWIGVSTLDSFFLDPFFEALSLR
jgi:putative tricarboxylic transport membrane protein